MGSLVYGIGLNSFTKIRERGGSFVKTYDVWRQTIFRCTDVGSEKYPAYIGCTISDNFKSFNYFYEWCQKQVGFNSRDENGRLYQIDKDILIKRNKLYSEDTCVFVPSKINSLLARRYNGRGNYPIGVSFHKHVKKFQARCSMGNSVEKHLGYFETKEQAFLAYKTFKESFIKYQAEKYKESIDTRAHFALLNYEVEITD